MYVLSRHGGFGRGIWRSIEEGTVTIKDHGDSFTAVVSGGLITQQVHRTGRECTTIRCGQDLIVTQSGKIVQQVFYEPGTIRAIRKSCLWKRQTNLKLCRTLGVLECHSSSNGSYAREVFTYSNGAVAYAATSSSRQLEIRRPSGKRWVVIDVEGRIQLTSTSIVERLDLREERLGLWSLMGWQDATVTVYGPSGTRPVTCGHFENHQRQGRWLHRGKVEYYLSGVPVSRSVFEEDPGQWDPQEVLKVPNTQLRSSLLNRMGYEKLLAKLPHELIDSDASDGSQLLSIKAPPEDDEMFLSRDPVLRLLRVICPSTDASYILRVPPTVETCQQARHWTFGLELDKVRSGSHLQLLAET